jgi:hypothetical protein
MTKKRDSFQKEKKNARLVILPKNEEGDASNHPVIVGTTTTTRHHPIIRIVSVQDQQTYFRPILQYGTKKD